MITLMKLIAVTALAAVASVATVSQARQNDIVGTAIGAGGFDTLVAAVKAAGLVDTLKAEGPFTVFAPTDAAFAKLPAGTVESLLQPENKDKLVAILTYHVIPGKVMASDVTGKQLAVNTVHGGTVDVFGMSGGRINNAHVTGADIGATNGVIHVLDTVLLPE